MKMARLSRRVLSWSILGLGFASLVVFAVSAMLHVGTSHLVGTSSGGFIDGGVAAGRSVEGSVPTPGQPGPSADRPTVALSFDDGIDREYTPQVLDVLDRYDVTATFFIIGSTVPGNEDILERIVADGHELGLHSYNHAQQGKLSTTEVRRQFRLNQEMLAGVVGFRPTIARLPYSHTAALLPEGELRAARAIDDMGITVVFSDRSPADYAPGVTAAELVRQSLPEDDINYILSLHDGGGDRQATIDALPVVIENLQQRGYRFEPIGEYGGVEARASLPFAARFTATGLVIATVPFRILVGVFYPMIIVLTVVLMLRFLASLYFSFVGRRQERERGIATVGPPVSIIVPAFNEEVGIRPALLSLRQTAYRGLVEIVVVDDGSTDQTAKIAASVPGVRVLRKANGGKASALNAGIRFASYEICILLDGDTVFTPETIGALVAEFTDPEVGAVSGYPRVGNTINLLTRLQYLEYAIGSAVERRLQRRLGFIYCIPGAVGAFRRSALRDAGGLLPVTLAEDTDLTVTLGARGWKIGHAPQAIALTESPATFGALWKQRKRWVYGVLQVAWKHRNRTDDTRNRTYQLGVVGYLGVMNVLLPLLTPVVDFLAVMALIQGHSSALLWSWLAMNGVQTFAAWFALRLDGDDTRYLIYAIPQAFFFRYFNFVLTVETLASALAGTEQAWNKPTRLGMTDAQSTPVPALSTAAGS